LTPAAGFTETMSSSTASESIARSKRCTLSIVAAPQSFAVSCEMSLLTCALVIFVTSADPSAGLRCFSHCCVYSARVVLVEIWSGSGPSGHETGTQYEEGGAPSGVQLPAITCPSHAWERGRSWTRDTVTTTNKASARKTTNHLMRSLAAWTYAAGGTPDGSRVEPEGSQAKGCS
jgi:hypothetical protein